MENLGVCAGNVVQKRFSVGLDAAEAQCQPAMTQSHSIFNSNKQYICQPASQPCAREKQLQTRHALSKRAAAHVRI